MLPVVLRAGSVGQREKFNMRLVPCIIPLEKLQRQKNTDVYVAPEAMPLIYFHGDCLRYKKHNKTI